MPLFPRPEMESIAACVHGGIDEAELSSLGLRPEAVTDFSVCCNPFGPPPAVTSAVRNASFHEYPDSTCYRFRLQVSKNIGVPTDLIAVGNGSMELLRAVGLAFIRPGDLCLIPAPTFGEYTVACQLMGGKISVVPATEANGFRIEASKMAAEVRNKRPKIVFLCNPNNPSGSYLSRTEIAEIASTNTETLFVIDEAYAGFVEHPWESAELIDRGNVLVVRSMTKDYGLAGLRLGFGFAAREIIEPLRKALLPWSVNSVAQVAGIAALEDGEEHLHDSLDRLVSEKKRLLGRLESIGVKAIPSQTNFFLIKIDDARAFRRRLIELGILVRDCTSFGLPQFIRIGVRTPQENHKLVSAIKEILVP